MDLSPVVTLRCGQRHKRLPFGAAMQLMPAFSVSGRRKLHECGRRKLHALYKDSALLTA